MTETVARPGRTFFAPDARILALGALTLRGEAGEVLLEARPDVVAVEVTRVATGASQFTITLSNWLDALGGGRSGRAERPAWPPFKYSAFEPFRFGRRLRIEMRYWPDAQEDLPEPVRSSHAWVPMVAGPIADMKFTFSNQEGARLVVEGVDDLFALQNKAPAKVEFRDRSEQQIIRDVLAGAAGYPLFPVDPAKPLPGFFTDPGRGLSMTLQEGQSFLEFLQKIAKDFDCEVFVEFDDLAADQPAVELHFEPSRSRIPPGEGRGALYLLERGKSLVEITPTFKVLDQYTGVTVKGRHRDRNRPERVTQAAAPSILADELYPQGDGLVPGPEVRRRFFAAAVGERFATNDHKLPNQSNVDPERAREMAAAVLRQRAREFMTIRGTTVGLPHLRPGVYVEIRGMRPPFDGFFYVEKTITRYGAGGLTTEFHARRPGMPLPPYEEE